MKTTDIITKRKPGRPRKDGSTLNIEKATAAALAAARKALKGDKPKETRPVKPFGKGDYNGVVTATFSRPNREHEIIVVGRRKTRFRKVAYDFLDIRLFFYSFDQERWFPTQRGTTVAIELAPELITAVATAVSASLTEGEGE